MWRRCCRRGHGWCIQRRSNAISEQSESSLWDAAAAVQLWWTLRTKRTTEEGARRQLAEKMRTAAIAARLCGEREKLLCWREAMPWGQEHYTKKKKCYCARRRKERGPAWHCAAFNVQNWNAGRATTTATDRFRDINQEESRETCRRQTHCKTGLWLCGVISKYVRGCWWRFSVIQVTVVLSAVSQATGRASTSSQNWNTSLRMFMDDGLPVLQCVLCRLHVGV